MRPDSIIVQLFLLIFSIDLILFGGGRVIEIEGLTLRMIIFPFLIVVSIISLVVVRKVSKTLVFVVLFFFIILVYSIFNDMLYGEFDVKRVSAVLFFTLSLVFYFYSSAIVSYFSCWIPKLALLMAISYLAFLLCLGFGYYDIYSIYLFLPNSELFLRGEVGFVYKGFIFVLIGALYFVIIPNYSVYLRLLFCLVCISAIVLTYTRGFLLSFGVVVFLYYQVEYKFGYIRLLNILIVVALCLYVWFFAVDYLFRLESDSTRINDIWEFINYTSEHPFRLIMGSGLNAYLGERPSVENAYMDIALRFGLVGLLAYLLIFLRVFLDFRKLLVLAPDKKSVDEYRWLFYSVLFVFIQSNFNSYVNNYIGGCFVLVVFFYFRKAVKVRMALNPSFKVFSSCATL